MTVLTPPVRRGAGRLVVAEVFGPTLQGEGPSVGQPAMFVRLSGCSLTCAWCDEPQTWDWTRYRREDESAVRQVDGLADDVLASAVGLVVVTGGEPLLQAAGLVALARRFRSAGQRVEVETNGTIVPPAELAEQVCTFNVSPKLAGSGVARVRRIKPNALRFFAGSGNAVFKFVIASATDVAEADALVRDFELRPVWVMPEGRTATDVLDRARHLADVALARGWSLSTRLHVLLWGDERGR